jgi:tRNA threonylcarbamoyladenosine biosynthesis protein TsaB
MSMHILALETTALTGTVAASEDANVLLELNLDPRQRSAQSLAPAIAKLLQQVGWKPQDVDLVAVTVGPGSFTGLRVGVTTAKTFAYAVEAKILGIDTFETIAMGISESRWGKEQSGLYSVPVSKNALHIALDAQRGDLITQTFLPSPSGWFHLEGDQNLLHTETWLHKLPPGSIIAGPVLGKLKARISEQVTVLPEALWHPHARHVALLAARDYAGGRRDDLWRLAPRYSRRSAAEEKWDAAGLSFPAR